MHGETWPCKGHARHINNTRGKTLEPIPPCGRWNGGRKRPVNISSSRQRMGMKPRCRGGERRRREEVSPGGARLLCAASLDKLKSCESSLRLHVCTSRAAAPPSGGERCRICFPRRQNTPLVQQVPHPVGIPRGKRTELWRV